MLTHRYSLVQSRCDQNLWFCPASRILDFLTELKIQRKSGDAWLSSMFVVYILESTVNNAYYIGQTNNLTRRLDAHNAGKNISTRRYRPWRIKYTREFSTRSEAVKFERHIKSLKKRSFINKIFTWVCSLAGSSSLVQDAGFSSQ